MKTIEGFVFGKARQGFNRYLKLYRSEFIFRSSGHKFGLDIKDYSLKEVMSVERYALLDKNFVSLLTEDELNAVNHITYKTKKGENLDI